MQIIMIRMLFTWTLKLLFQWRFEGGCTSSLKGLSLLVLGIRYINIIRPSMALSKHLKCDMKKLCEQGMINCQLDPNLYCLFENRKILITIIYVDDFLLIQIHPSKIKWLHDQLLKRFVIFFLGHINLRLGV